MTGKIKLIAPAVTLAVILLAAPAQTQEDFNSGNSMLPRCKAWLHMLSHDLDTVKNEIATADVSPGGIPAYFMWAGMCAGEVAGIAETLNMAGSDERLACIPTGVTKEQLVRVVVETVEHDPAMMHEDFGTLASAAIIAAWPCRK